MRRRRPRALALAIAAVVAVPLVLASVALALVHGARKPHRTLRAPAMLPGVTLSPQPGWRYALPGTQISFLGAPASDLREVIVRGSASGVHEGRLEPYASAAGASFLPAVAFTPGERVTVRAVEQAGRSARPLTTSFTVATPAAVSHAPFPGAPGTARDVQRFRSQPDLVPPVLTVTTPATHTAPGLLLMTPSLGPGQAGPLILDNAGNIVWSKPVPAGQEAENLRVQRYAGQPVLTWWQGEVNHFGYGTGEYEVIDSSYRRVAVEHAGNGLAGDGHEFTLTPGGAAYLTAFSPVRASFAPAARASGIVLDGVVQEVDVRTGLVMSEWHSLDHVSVGDSYSAAPRNLANPYDYFHINSIFLEPDGNVLISARNTWAVYDIARSSGALRWTLGGRASTFKLGPGVAFAYQHNGEALSATVISLFDDEGAPTVRGPSRGELITIDPQARTATLADQFIHDPRGLVTGSQVNLEHLPNGDWLVGWGGLPNLTEFNSAGQVVFDAQLPAGENSYRVYRAQWSGQPSYRPSLATGCSAAGATTAYASWNGATTVASWQVLAGPSAAALTVVATVPRSGFETAIPLGAAEPTVQVRALGASRTVLATRPAVAG